MIHRTADEIGERSTRRAMDTIGLGCAGWQPHAEIKQHKEVTTDVTANSRATDVDEVRANRC